MRQTTEAEKSALRSHYMFEMGMTREEANDLNLEFSGAIDNYITDCPCYAGKVIIVIASGTPSIHDVFIEREGKLKLLEKEN